MIKEDTYYNKATNLICYLDYSLIAVGNYYSIFHMRSSFDISLTLKDHLF
jgi:hypothetical protein